MATSSSLLNDNKDIPPPPPTMNTNPLSSAVQSVQLKGLKENLHSERIKTNVLAAFTITQAGLLSYLFSTTEAMRSAHFATIFKGATDLATWIGTQGTTFANWSSTQGSNLAGWIGTQGTTFANWSSTQGSNFAGWIGTQGTNFANWSSTQGSHFLNWSDRMRQGGMDAASATGNAISHWITAHASYLIAFSIGIVSGVAIGAFLDGVEKYYTAKDLQYNTNTTTSTPSIDNDDWISKSWKTTKDIGTRLAKLTESISRRMLIPFNQNDKVKLGTTAVLLASSGIVLLASVTGLGLSAAAFALTVKVASGIFGFSIGFGIYQACTGRKAVFTKAFGDISKMNCQSPDWKAIRSKFTLPDNLKKNPFANVNWSNYNLFAKLKFLQWNTTSTNKVNADEPGFISVPKKNINSVPKNNINPYTDFEEISLSDITNDNADKPPKFDRSKINENNENDDMELV